MKLLIELEKFQKIHKKKNSEHYKEIPKERYISPGERQKIIDDPRLI